MSGLYACGACCFVLSIWGVVQLVIMGICYKIESSTLVIDVMPEESAFDTIDDYLKEVKYNFAAVLLLLGLCNGWHAPLGSGGQSDFGFIPREGGGTRERRASHLGRNGADPAVGRRNPEGGLEAPAGKSQMGRPDHRGDPPCSRGVLAGGGFLLRGSHVAEGERVREEQSHAGSLRRRRVRGRRRLVDPLLVLPDGGQRGPDLGGLGPALHRPLSLNGDAPNAPGHPQDGRVRLNRTLTGGLVEASVRVPVASSSAVTSPGRVPPDDGSPARRGHGPAVSLFFSLQDCEKLLDCRSDISSLDPSIADVYMESAKNRKEESRRRRG
ncbi:hypothetical protein evm_007608 [Chilo suppressalis]|nr:hypothetical protein evm_007608 [Chilo suppressalis]